MRKLDKVHSNTIEKVRIDMIFICIWNDHR